MENATLGNRKVIFAASTISAVGAAVFLILPLLIGAATESLHLSTERAGLVASSYFLGYMLICLTGVLWIHRVNWRVTSTSGFVLLVVGLVISALTSDYQVVLCGMFVAGCGGGVLFGLALCVISELQDPDRSFGVKLVAEQFLGAALLFSLPFFIENGGGFRALTLTTALVLGGFCVVSFWIPAKSKKTP